MQCPGFSGHRRLILGHRSKRALGINNTSAHIDQGSGPGSIETRLQSPLQGSALRPHPGDEETEFRSNTTNLAQALCLGGTDNNTGIAIS